MAPYTFGIPRISHASFTRYFVGKLSLPSRICANFDEIRRERMDAWTFGQRRRERGRGGGFAVAGQRGRAAGLPGGEGGVLLLAGSVRVNVVPFSDVRLCASLKQPVRLAAIVDSSANKYVRIRTDLTSVRVSLRRHILRRLMYVHLRARGQHVQPPKYLYNNSKLRLFSRYTGYSRSGELAAIPLNTQHQKSEAQFM